MQNQLYGSFAGFQSYLVPTKMHRRNKLKNCAFIWDKLAVDQAVTARSPSIDIGSSFRSFITLLGITFYGRASGDSLSYAD